MAQKQRALQRGVVAGNHGKTIQTQDVALLHPAGGDRVVCAVGVDARLEPGPAVHQFGVRVALSDFPHHGVGRGQRHLVLGHAFFQGSHQGCGPDVAHLGTVGNELDLFGALDHAQRHAGRADIDKLDLG